MLEFIKTIVNALKMYIDEKVSDLNQFINDKLISSRADWNQNDETAADYVKNRPFYSEEVILCEKMVSLEDEVLPVVTYELGKNYIVEVNNIPIELTFVSAYSELAGEYRVGFNIEDGYRDVIKGDICEHALYSLNTYTEEELSNGFITDELRFLSGELALGSVNVKVLFTAVHQIDPKYIKDMYYEGEVTIFNSGITATDMGGGYGGVLSKFILENGKQYKIIVDDNSYVCTATFASDINADVPVGVIICGNMLGIGGEDTGEPFCIAYFPELDDAQIAFLYINEDTTFNIEIREFFVKQIDEKYIPDMPNSFVITADCDNDLVTDCDFNQAHEAYINGCNIILRLMSQDSDGEKSYGYCSLIHVSDYGFEFVSYDTYTCQENHYSFANGDSTHISRDIWDFSSNELTTTDKTIVGAINEVNEKSSESVVFTVNITANEDETLSANKTLDEIVEAYNNGKNIQAYFMDTIYSLINITFTDETNTEISEFVFGNAYASESNSSFIQIGINHDGVFIDFYSWGLYNEISDLTTEDKTIVGAINELNAKHTEGTDSLILLSHNGTKFSITVGDDGVLTATEITE